MLNSVEEARRRDPSVCTYCGWEMVRGTRRWHCVNTNCLKPLRTHIDPLDPALSESTEYD